MLETKYARIYSHNESLELPVIITDRPTIHVQDSSTLKSIQHC